MKIFSIEYLLSANFIIFRLTENEVTERYSWWIVDEFKPPTTVGVESIDFGYLKGTEITDFVERNSMIQDKISFLNLFQSFIESREQENMILEFSHLMKWKKYSRSR